MHGFPSSLGKIGYFILLITVLRQHFGKQFKLCDAQVVVAHGNGPQVGMVNNAMIALTHEDPQQPNTPLSVCVAMSQAYIGYDLQNALREELLNRDITDIPVATMITQVRVDPDDPAFSHPSKPIGRFMTKEQADMMSEKYDYIMKEDAGRGYRRVVASPKPQEIIEIGTIRTMVDSGDLVIACGGGGIPVTRQGNHLKGASAVIDKDFASCLLAKELDADFLMRPSRDLYISAGENPLSGNPGS